MRRATTIVEVLIAAAIGTVVLSAVFLLFHLGDKSRGVTASARALQTAMLIQEHITNDCARLVSNGMPFRFDVKKTDWIGFLVIDSKEKLPGGAIGVHAVEYRLPAEKSLLIREFAAEDSPIGPSPLEKVEFLPFRSIVGPMLRVNLTVGRTKDDPDGPPLVHTFVVRPSTPGVPGDIVFKPLSDFKTPREPSKDSAKLPVPEGLFPGDPKK